MIIDATKLKDRYLQRIAGVRDKKVYIGPEIVTLEIANTCNLRCQYCATDHAPRNPHHFDKAHFLAWEKFVEIISDCIDLNVDQIDLGGSGEPTMHPLFREMMRHLEQQPFWVRLVTNATFPHDFCSDVIKGDQVVINLGAVNRKQYQDMHGKDMFDCVVANIERLVSLRDAGKPGFIVEIVYIVNAMNTAQKQKMRDLASRLGVNWVTFTKMNVHDYNRRIALPEGRRGHDEKRTPPACFNAWFNVIVRLDGSLSSCYRIHQMHGCDIKKRSFKQVWLSRHMMNMRLLGKYGHIQKIFKECQTCSYYDKNIQYFQDLSGRPLSRCSKAAAQKPRIKTKRGSASRGGRLQETAGFISRGFHDY